MKVRQPPHGEFRAEAGNVPLVGLVASAFVKVPLVTDTDAPRSVVRVVEKTGEGRLRFAAGSREWLGPAC